MCGREGDEEKAGVEKRRCREGQQARAEALVVHEPQKAPRQNRQADVDDRQAHRDQHPAQQRALPPAFLFILVTHSR